MQLVVRLSLFLASAVVVAASPAGAQLLHDYQLNGTYADSLGGPALVPNGGSLGATGYTFAANQGLSLSNALPSPGSYEIEIGVTLDLVTGYRKLIDFKNLTTDDGLYNFSTSLGVYPEDFGPAGAIAAGVPVVIRLTRNGTTGEVVGYVNGVEQFRFIDTDGVAVFDAAANIIQFLQDDSVTSGSEATSGFIDFIRIFAGPAAVAAPVMDSRWLVATAALVFGIGLLRLRRESRSVA